MGDNTVEDWFILYEKDITSFLIYYTGSMDIEDLVQDTFVIALKKINQFKKQSHPKTWLISIARNIVIDKYRRKKVWEKIKYIVIQERQFSYGLEEQLLTEQGNNQLYKAINRLSSKSKEIVILRGILELPSKEVSEIVRKNTNYVNVTYHRALKKLKNLLEEDGFTYETTGKLTRESKKTP